MPATLVKICGLGTADDTIAAARAGADFAGFVFVAKSPRHIAPDAAHEIVLETKQVCEDEGLAVPKFVGLFVDAGEKLLAETAPFLTHFQFHGHEDADRIDEMRSEFAVEIIKAVGVGGVTDLVNVEALADAADYLLFDARPPKSATLPGGNGVSFDWGLLAQYQAQTPFLLAGGLRPETVAEAIRAVSGHTAFAGVDVSTGVEARLGAKDPALIERFVRAAKG
ncbi:MAG: phosphoribosylanthranilate isomerase [Parvularculaceae bacterium]|nr:phosphoribosylanthranilate isomerase [Parvularculaceae bacterium]